MVYPLDLGEQWTDWTLLSFTCTIAAAREASFGDLLAVAVFLVRFAYTEFLELLVSP
jgi:hypothetical protein